MAEKKRTFFKKKKTEETTEETPAKDSPAKETSGHTPSKFQQMRGSRKFRLWLIGILLVIVAILFFFFEKLRIILAVAFIALLAAFGLEVSQSDFDLGKLWETKSFEQSKVSRDESGNILFDKDGNITTDSTKGKKASDYNCDDFSSQPQAQSFFGKVKNDLYRLDGDKDGNACESLPKNEK